MISGGLVKIFFLYPDNVASTREEFGKSISDLAYPAEGFDYAGFENKDSRENFFINMTSDEYSAKYHPLDEKTRAKVKQVIESTLQKCHEVVNFPDLPLVIYVSPWFPSEEDNQKFGGVHGFSPYKKVIHISLSVDDFNYVALRETVVHEINHTLFYYKQKPFVSTIRDYLLMEGLAENFREEVLGGEPAPWSIALGEDEARQVLKRIIQDGLFHEEDSEIYSDVFYGSSEYKRWTGYSIGYWVVKKFRKSNPLMSWNEVMSLPLEKFYESYM